jgi:hypothetical protein
LREVQGFEAFAGGCEGRDGRGERQERDGFHVFFDGIAIWREFTDFLTRLSTTASAAGAEYFPVSGSVPAML